MGHETVVSESAKCPTSVKDVVTLLVNSKRPGKVGVHTTFES